MDWHEDYNDNDERMLHNASVPLSQLRVTGTRRGFFTGHQPYQHEYATTPASHPQGAVNTYTDASRSPGSFRQYMDETEHHSPQQERKYPSAYRTGAPSYVSQTQVHNSPTLLQQGTPMPYQQTNWQSQPMPVQSQRCTHCGNDPSYPSPRGINPQHGYSNSLQQHPLPYTHAPGPAPQQPGPYPPTQRLVPIPLTPDGKFQNRSTYEHRQDPNPFQDSSNRVLTTQGRTSDMAHGEYQQQAQPPSDDLGTHSRSLNKAYPHAYLNRRPGCDPNGSAGAPSGFPQEGDVAGSTYRGAGVHGHNNEFGNGPEGHAGSGYAGTYQYGSPQTQGGAFNMPLTTERVTKRHPVGERRDGSSREEGTPSYEHGAYNPGTSGFRASPGTSGGQLGYIGPHIANPAGGRSGVAIYRYGDAPTTERQEQLSIPRPSPFGKS